MIESLKVRCFQPHVEFDLDLDPCLTVLVGPSDQGKSAVLRALRWACCNSIRGDDFVTHGKETSSVTITVDGHEVTRQTGKGGNFYRLDNGEPYKSFRADVPEDVANLLNVDDSLNFQGQLDPPFWLSLSPGEVSRELNRIVNLERIDSVLSRCAGELRKAKASLQVTEERLDAARQERDRLSWVVDACRKYDHIEALRDDLAQKRTERVVLDSAIEDATRLDQSVRIKGNAVRDAGRLLRAIDELESLVGRKDELESAVGDAEETCRRIENVRRARVKEESLLAEQTKGLCPLCGSPFAS